MVSIIIVTFNGENFIARLLESIFNQSYKEYEVIIVDNNSKDNTLNIINEFNTNFFGSNLKLVEMGYNSGYTKALNKGIQIARGEFILVLNQDTYLDKNYIKEGLKGFKDNKIGLVAGTILRFDKKTVDSTGQFLSLSFYPVERGYNKNKSQLDYERGYVFSVCGAVAFYRKKMLKDLEYKKGKVFDEDFFMFFDDIDLGWRANRKNWKSVYIPAARAYHYRSGTITSRKKVFLILKRDSFLQYHIIKNRYLTLIKNVKLSRLFLHIPFIIVRDSLYLILFLIKPVLLTKIIKNYKLFLEAYNKRKK